MNFMILSLVKEKLVGVLVGRINLLMIYLLAGGTNERNRSVGQSRASTIPVAVQTRT